jgi:cytochrome d ubiquinol oxidase subunit II
MTEILPIIWYILLAFLLTGYAILDGFDFGVGILHPLARNEHERRIAINAIAPIWDGNEVWLVTFGGALFAAFPEAYATVFSGFYIPFMLVLLALIFRAVSIEFRGKIDSERWRRIWDWGFFGSSLLASLLFGVAVGNGLMGIPLDERGLYLGGFFNLLNPYALLTGLLTVALFAMHGCLFLYLKTPESDFRIRLRNWMWHTWGIFLVLYMLATMYTLLAVPTAVPNFEKFPWVSLFAVVSVFSIANIPRAIYANLAGQAFISSCVTIVSLIAITATALFPNLVIASNDPALSLTIWRAASSDKTLQTMLLIAIIGMPFVLAYTVAIYWTFRGQVEPDKSSY